MQRRDFVKLSAGALTAAWGTHDLKGSRTLHRTTANEKPYGIQYYEQAEQIWNRIATTELPIIAEAADRAVTSLKSNKQIYCQIVGGHMHRAEFARSRPGNPDYLHHWSRKVEPSKFDVIESGDFLLFDFPRPHIKKARERGAFTVGIRVPYYPNQTIPKGVLAMNELAMHPVYEEILMTEECSDIVLTSGVPFTDGVLYIPEIPAVRVSPISPQGTHNFYWMLTAEIAMRHRGGSSMGATDRATEYIELIKNRGRKLLDDFNHIDAVAKAMVEYVSQGAEYWNYPVIRVTRDPVTKDDSLGAIMVTENTHRASGPVMSRLIDTTGAETSHWVKNKRRGKPGDFVFIAGETSDLKENIDAAKAFKRAGLKVIYIGPITEGSGPEDLSNIADWHINTYSPEREGALEVCGLNMKICPTTGVLYPLAQYMLNAQFIERMIKADMTPLVGMGVHLIGAKAYCDVVEKICDMRRY